MSNPEILDRRWLGTATAFATVAGSAMGLAGATCTFDSGRENKGSSAAASTGTSIATGTSTATGAASGSAGATSVGGGGSTSAGAGGSSDATAGTSTADTTTVSTSTGAGGGTGGTTSTTSGTGGAPTTGSAGAGGSVGTGGSSPKDAGTMPIARGSVTYTKIAVHRRFLAESASIGDFNKDGNPDIASGRRWWEGPSFMVEHTYRPGHEDLPANGTSEEITLGVSDDWADYVYDMNGDGWPDIIDIASCDADTNQPGSNPVVHGTGYWYQNPAPPNANVNWTRYQIHGDIRLEQHMLVDITGDGKPEILGACRACGQAKGYYEADWKNPTGMWTFHPVTRAYEFPFGNTGWFHGIGAGDVNGDGKTDLLERSGYWLQPASATGAWTFVNTALSVPEVLGNTGAVGGGHMMAYDVDGDGDSDIVTSLNSHDYGLAWFEQTTPGKFVKHMIANTPQEAAMYGGISMSQMHSVAFGDLDGDGLTDFVTGKTFLAHPYPTNDPGARDPIMSYAFKLVRDPPPAKSGGAHFEPHLLDNEAGVGRQFMVGHLNNDGITDIVVSSKKGLFVFLGKP